MSPAPPERCTRRDAIRLSVAGALGSVFGSAFASALGCVGAAGAPAAGGGPDGRLTVRAAPPPTAPVAPGFHPLSLGDTMRDGVLYVPPGLAAAPAPLVLAFHGAGGQGARFARRIVAAADAAGVLLLAADSRGSTWDRIGGEFGPDVEFLARAVALAQRRRAVDTARLALAGFSDGASYALSLGLTNGDVFGRVIAFSPGFSAPGGFRGRPRLFVSHGTADAILPIERTSRRLVPELRGQGYDVTYREFEGPHTVPEDVARAAFGWLAGSWA
jgi:phospholipase/carboxylesterase